MAVDPIATDQIQGLSTYLQSLDWSEPWLYYLLVFHILLLTLIVCTRRYPLIQSGIFLSLLLIVYEAEPFNEYLAKNHKLFTDHQYFDSSGLFISVIMSLPFLLFSAFIVANWFYVSTQLMTELRVHKVGGARRAKEE